MTRSFKDALTKALSANPDHDLAKKIERKSITPIITASIKPSIKSNTQEPVKQVNIRVLAKNVGKSMARRTTPRYKHLQDERVPQKPVRPIGPPQVVLKFSGQAKLEWKPIRDQKRKLRKIDLAKASQTNVSKGEGLVPRPLVMGIDFGTSCTKVVISDRNLKQAFAVPFMDELGILSYLLPTSLQENQFVYSLDGAGESWNDLKLSLMANQQDSVIISRVVAYLALVIRYSRAWFFNNYSNQYSNSDLLWSIAIGQPADHALSFESKELFSHIGNLAWILSLSSESFTAQNILNRWELFKLKEIKVEDFDCLIIPELAAQIHGFVNSDNFDPKKPNIFLMIDIGAGTLDLSIFSVRILDSGFKKFNLFMNSVQPHGVANFHRHRVNWWQQELRQNELGVVAVQQLQSIKMPTEFQGFYPDSFLEYVSQVDVDFLNGALNPDLEFDKTIERQVNGCLLKSIKPDSFAGRILAEKDFNGMEYFLCGGGSRHSQFKGIHKLLQQPQGWNWLKLKPRVLTVPSSIILEGVQNEDYDRLSVAYGLSLLDFDEVTQVEKMHSIRDDQISNWNVNYVDKDIC
jgi:hypothetical protein